MDDITKARPVQWLSVRELWNSAKRAALSKTIGDYVDRREVFAALTPRADMRVAGAAPTETWVDYVADVGDGYQATRAVALCQAGDLEHDELTKRAGTIVFGGDQVYPTPSVEAYQQRFRGPYDDAILGDRKIYAIPGNHDWYDGLTAFFKLFVAGSSMSLEHAQQSRSYFSFRVDEHPWWVWGIDFGLSGALDVPQMQYFTALSEQLEDSDTPVGLVICTAEPFWEKGEDAMWKAIEQLIPKQTASILFLSGDKHYLATWANTGDNGVVQAAPNPPSRLAGKRVAFVTAGGGGAYLSLTSATPPTELLCGTSRQALYPDSKLKRSLLLRALSPRSGIWPLALATYVAMIMIVRLASNQAALLAGFVSDADDGIRRVGLSQIIEYLAGQGGWWTTTQRFLREAVGATVPWVGAGLIVVAMIAFARKGAPRDPDRRWLPWVAGTVHAIAHLVGITAVAVVALELASDAGSGWPAAITISVVLAITLALFRPPVRTQLQLLIAFVAVMAALAADALWIDGHWLSEGLTHLAVVFAGSAVVGHAIFMAYLAAVANVRLNLNEASVALASEQYKNFVRLRFAADSELTVFVYGIDDTARVIERSGTSAPRYDDLCEPKCVFRVPLRPVG